MYSLAESLETKEKFMNPVEIFTLHYDESKKIKLKALPNSLPQGKIISDIKVQEVFNQVLAMNNLSFLKNEEVEFHWRGKEITYWDINTSSGLIEAKLINCSSEKFKDLKNRYHQKQIGIGFGAITITAIATACFSKYKYGTFSPLQAWKIYKHPEAQTIKA